MNKVKEIRERIGPLVMQQVGFEEMILRVKERLAGAQNPGSAVALRANVKEFTETLDKIITEIKGLRCELIAELQKQLTIVRMQMQESMNAFDLEELRHLEHDLLTEIERQNLIVYGTKK